MTEDGDIFGEIIKIVSFNTFIMNVNEEKSKSILRKNHRYLLTNLFRNN